MPKPEKLLLCLFLTDQMISFFLGGGLANKIGPVLKMELRFLRGFRHDVSCSAFLFRGWIGEGRKQKRFRNLRHYQHTGTVFCYKDCVCGL
jgi:hypothetical protein